MCVSAQSSAPPFKFTMPTGMVPPIPIHPESEPKVYYYYDPTDHDVDEIGDSVHLSVPERIDSDDTEEFLTYLTYRELTGCEEYDGFYDGYPACKLEETIPVDDFQALFSIKEPIPEEFDSRLFAVASWHRVLT